MASCQNPPPLAPPNPPPFPLNHIMAPPCPPPPPQNGDGDLLPLSNGLVCKGISPEYNYKRVAKSRWTFLGRQSADGTLFGAATPPEPSHSAACASCLACLARLRVPSLKSGGLHIPHTRDKGWPSTVMQRLGHEKTEAGGGWLAQHASDPIHMRSTKHITSHVRIRPVNGPIPPFWGGGASLHDPSFILPVRVCNVCTASMC